jgi:hypothetical protein
MVLLRDGDISQFHREKSTGTFRPRHSPASEHSGGTEMLLMKFCPRCKGDLYLEEDGVMRDLVCIQCGNRPPNGAAVADIIVQRARERSRAKAA